MGLLLSLVALLGAPIVQQAPAPRTGVIPSQRLTDAYMNALCRPPDDTETVEWDSRPFEVPQVRNALRATPEGERVEAIREVYVKVLGRDRFGDDCDVVRRWVDERASEDQIVREVIASAEARRVADVRRAFLDVFARDPIGWDNATLRYWTDSPFTLPEIKARLAAQKPRVGVHYFVWYGGEQREWGNGADIVGPDAPWPLLGPYQSWDPITIDAHLDQMTAAGFDFVMLHANPEAGQLDNVRTFFRRLIGRRLRAAVVLDGLYVRPASVKGMWVEQVKQEFSRHPNYFFFHGKPLIILYSARIDFDMPDVELRNLYWADSYGPGANSFNSGPLEAHDWPFWAPTPQPLTNGVVPVMPGYSDTHLGRVPAMEHPRNNGRLYHAQWRRALALRPELIMVYSWNEHFERTAIEPTNTWGDRYLQWTACYTRHAHQGTTGPC